MKVLCKAEDQQYQVICSCCRAQLSVTELDVYIVEKPPPGWPYSYCPPDYIFRLFCCPICGKETIINLHGRGIRPSLETRKARYTEYRKNHENKYGMLPDYGPVYLDWVGE